MVHTLSSTASQRVCWVSELLAQAAETDPTLADFRLAAADLDAHSAEADAYERAKMFVDAARGRLANI